MQMQRFTDGMCSPAFRGEGGAVRHGRGRPAPGRATVVALAVLLGICAIRAAYGDETQVTSSAIIDYEFDPDDALLTWVDTSNRLWVAGVDRNTGDFVPVDGKGTLVDTDAATAPTFGNGPEWVKAADGYHIVYTKYEPGTASLKSAATASIGVASLIDGQWQPRVLPNTLGFIEPIGNVNPSLEDPPIAFRTGAGGWQLYSQGIDDATPLAIPGTDLSEGSERFVEGRNAMVYTGASTDDNGNVTRQAFMYDLDTDTTTQLTFGDKNKAPIFMWQAPEFGDAYVFFTVTDSTDIVFYRLLYRVPDGKVEWTPFRKLTTPDGAPAYIWSPEPFTWQGKSYLMMVRSPSPNPQNLAIPTQIWITSMDGTVNRQVSDPAIVDRVRMDPEVFVTRQGPQIYYNVYTPAQPQQGKPARPAGVYRSDTGLGD